MLTKDQIRNLPKVELHLHLDCSLSLAAVQRMDAAVDEQIFRRDFIAPEKCIDLADYLRCTFPAIKLLQREAHLRWAVDDLFEQLQAENVIYAEIRFAPLQHVQGNLKAEAVVEIVADETQKMIRQTGIQAGILLCTLRHFSEAQSMKTVRLVEKFLPNSPVAGFDIAADEAGFPIDAHLAAFQYAIKHDIPRTCHAGEARGPQSVWETLQNFQPGRIGHGVRSIEDERLLDALRESNIHLEVCPSCNIQIDIYDEYQNHPVDKLLNAGISLGINTDTRTLTDITLTQEYLRLQQFFNWDLNHFKQVNLNAIEHAFISKSLKELLAKEIDSGYSRQ